MDVSIVPTEVNIKVKGGDTLALVVRIGDEDGPVDLDGATIAGQARRLFESEEAVDFDIAVDGDEVTIGLDHETTADMVGNWQYDIQSTIDGVVRTLFGGRLTVVPDVTRD